MLHNNSTHIIYIYIYHTLWFRPATSCRGCCVWLTVSRCRAVESCCSSLGGCPVRMLRNKTIIPSTVFCWPEIPGIPNSPNQAHPRRQKLPLTEVHDTFLFLLKLSEFHGVGLNFMGRGRSRVPIVIFPGRVYGTRHRPVFFWVTSLSYTFTD